MEWKLTTASTEAALTVKLVVSPGRFAMHVIDAGGTSMTVAQADVDGSVWHVRALLSHHEEVVAGERDACQVLLHDVHEIFPGAQLTPIATQRPRPATAAA